MAFSLKANTGGGTSQNGGTTSAVDTTGANLIVISVACGNGASPAVSDNMGNTLNYVTIRSDSQSGLSNTLFYCSTPTVGAGHTFTVVAVNGFPAIFVQAWAGAAASSVLDQQNGAASANATSLQPGSVTPGNDNELLVTGLFYTANTVLSIDSSFTISDSAGEVGGTNYGGGMAYLVQGSAAPVNPTWTEAGSNTQMATNIATFVSGAASYSESISLGNTTHIAEHDNPAESVSLRDTLGISLSVNVYPSPVAIVNNGFIFSFPGLYQRSKRELSDNLKSARRKNRA